MGIVRWSGEGGVKHFLEISGNPYKKWIDLPIGICIKYLIPLNFRLPRIYAPSNFRHLNEFASFLFRSPSILRGLNSLPPIFAPIEAKNKGNRNSNGRNSDACTCIEISEREVPGFLRFNRKMWRFSTDSFRSFDAMFYCVDTTLLFVYIFEVFWCCGWRTYQPRRSVVTLTELTSKKVESYGVEIAEV